MRVLHITGRKRTGGWLAEALAADSASEIQVDLAMGTTAGLTRLRDEVFDAVLVSHVPGELDALPMIEGYRAAGAEEPIVVLGTESEQEMSVPCFEVGADGYVCVNTATTRNLIWVIARAIQRHQLARENRRLSLGEQNRYQREREEVDRLLEDQRRLVSEAEPVRKRPGGSTRPLDVHKVPRLPAELIAHYRELLRTYVIMGSGNLSGELGQLATLLVSAGLDARQIMHLHLYVLEELIHGLGTRSSRHVMSRADLLALELMIHVADGYHRRYDECIHPPVQRLLPGFEKVVRCTAPSVPTVSAPGTV